MLFQEFDEVHVVTNPRFIIERENGATETRTRTTALRGQ